MFDIGFSELIVIAVVALIVIGPERLPKEARTAGHLLGRLQRYVNDVKSDINREMQLEELKKLQGQIQDSARSFENSIQQGLSSTEQSLNNAIQPPTAAETAPEPVPAATAAAPTPEAPVATAPTGADAPKA
ncbi:MAG TPA: Sec-independent protein translocase protein TatB [Azospira sp.]|nr:Sec-independent protein translocase protein TatB [Azospira sp.]